MDKKYGPKVDKYSVYNWNQNEYDALVSFAYNIGSIDGLIRLKALRTRSGDSSQDPGVQQGGVERYYPASSRRRQEERKLF